jgi:hypothetical protein
MSAAEKKGVDLLISGAILRNQSAAELLVVPAPEHLEGAAHR